MTSSPVDSPLSPHTGWVLLRCKPGPTETTTVMQISVHCDGRRAFLGILSFNLGGRKELYVLPFTPVEGWRR